MKEWKKPTVKTVKEEEVNEVIVASACSIYGCLGSRTASPPPILY